MTKYLISFPGAAMDLDESEFEAAGRDSRAVIEEAKQAGVYVFAGGLNESEPTVRVSANASVTPGAYPKYTDFTGGYTILELPTREDAVHWAQKIAAACRCDQELREFMYDPAS